MVRTRYYKLKLILAPVIGASAAIASQSFFGPAVQAYAAVIGAAATALWALVNEVPRKDQDNG